MGQYHIWGCSYKIDILGGYYSSPPLHHCVENRFDKYMLYNISVSCRRVMQYMGKIIESGMGNSHDKQTPFLLPPNPYLHLFLQIYLSHLSMTSSSFFSRCISINDIVRLHRDHSNDGIRISLVMTQTGSSWAISPPRDIDK